MALEVKKWEEKKGSTSEKKEHKWILDRRLNEGEPENKIRKNKRLI